MFRTKNALWIVEDHKVARIDRNELMIDVLLGLFELKLFINEQKMNLTGMVNKCFSFSPAFLR